MGGPYLGGSEWLNATWLSLLAASFVVLLSTVLGTLVALGRARLPAHLFAFIVSFDELIVSLFLSGSGAITLPR